MITRLVIFLVRKVQTKVRCGNVIPKALSLKGLSMTPYKSLPLAGSVDYRGMALINPFFKKGFFHALTVLGSYGVGVQTKKPTS